MKILYVVPALIDGGGVEKILYDWISRFDKKLISVDILAGKILSENKKREFEKLGCNVYEFSCSMWRLDKRVPKFHEVLKNKYDILHIHCSSPFNAWMLYIAKKTGIRIRIIHSHNAVESKKVTTRFVFFIMKPFLRKYATHFWGCSEKAIYTLCGKTKKFVDNHRVIKNAIQVENYVYDEQIRKKVRAEYNLDGHFVVGNVGRLCSQKNQLFLLDIFSEVLRKKEKAFLLLIGDGNQKKLLERKAEQLGISENILFTGNVPNVNEFYQSMDCFVMPSLYEGLVIAGIEAQCAGLTCLFSSSITEEIKITNNVEFISLNEEPTYWAKQICATAGFERRNMTSEIKAAGYEIESAAKELQKLYLDIEI